MKRILNCFVALAAVSALCLTSCKSGDEEDDPIRPEVKDLVSADVPSYGWSGETGNGILKYSPSEYDADEANAYYAFKMEDEVCESAVLNVVMSSVSEARQIARILNDGTWVGYDDDDDEEDYRTAPSTLNRFRFIDMTAAVMRHIGRANATRAGLTLPIPVQQEGRVIYVVLPNVKGLSVADLRMVMDIWNGNSSRIPDHVVFGKYENGTYTCSNMHGMNIDYVVETKFNADGNCTKYVTRITLPSEGWAQFYYDVLEEQTDDFEIQFGRRPDLMLNGKTVELDAVIVGDVPRSQIDMMIYALDWLNNRPFISNLF